MNIAELGGYIMRVSEFVDNGTQYQCGIENTGFRRDSEDMKESGDENLIEAEHVTFGPPTNSNIRIIESRGI